MLHGLRLRELCLAFTPHTPGSNNKFCMEQTIVGFILLVFGGLNAVRPDVLMRFQIWSQRVIMGAKYEPSHRTYTVIRIFGGVFIVLGLLVITGAIK